jgi:formamidopyrimidine-DNA glycosylase
MLEIPEAAVMAKQINDILIGKRINQAQAAYTPHGLTWYYGDPATYGAILQGTVIQSSRRLGGQVELQTDGPALLFSDGVNLRYHPTPETFPAKHQILLSFEDGSALSGVIAMYGGISCYQPGEFDNPYYRIALEKPSLLENAFDAAYFESLFTSQVQKLSMKAFLATEQRIPGLGNGVLQDVLYLARLHPKRKVNSLQAAEKSALFTVLKETLQRMVEQGGRDTEKDLFGAEGGYHTLMSKNTVGKACPQCAATIEKQAYMGGSIYFCPVCQPG